MIPGRPTRFGPCAKSIIPDSSITPSHDQTEATRFCGLDLVVVFSHHSNGKPALKMGRPMDSEGEGRRWDQAFLGKLLKRGESGNRNKEADASGPETLGWNSVTLVGEKEQGRHAAASSPGMGWLWPRAGCLLVNVN
jgi:hypothetical protein